MIIFSIFLVAKLKICTKYIFSRFRPHKIISPFPIFFTESAWNYPGYKDNVKVRLENISEDENKNNYEKKNILLIIDKHVLHL
jgi:hypothetical protein